MNWWAVGTLETAMGMKHLILHFCAVLYRSIWMYFDIFEFCGYAKRLLCFCLHHDRNALLEEFVISEMFPGDHFPSFQTIWLMGHYAVSTVELWYGFGMMGTSQLASSFYPAVMVSMLGSRKLSVSCWWFHINGLRLDCVEMKFKRSVTEYVQSCS